MPDNDTINRILGALGDHVLKTEHKSPRRVYLEIAPETVFEASEVMFEEIGARLQIATGIDTPAGIEVMYHCANPAQSRKAGAGIHCRNMPGRRVDRTRDLGTAGR
jgi:hypothetical protein